MDVVAWIHGTQGIRWRVPPGDGSPAVATPVLLQRRRVPRWHHARDHHDPGAAVPHGHGRTPRRGTGGGRERAHRDSPGRHRAGPGRRRHRDLHPPLARGHDDLGVGAHRPRPGRTLRPLRARGQPLRGGRHRLLRPRPARVRPVGWRPRLGRSLVALHRTPASPS